MPIYLPGIINAFSCSTWLPCLAYSITTGTVKSECLGYVLGVVVMEMKKQGIAACVSTDI